MTLTTKMAVTQDFSGPEHHTPDGFRNPFPDFEEKGFSDFIKWSVIDRFKGKKEKKPEKYSFKAVENNGQYLRANKTEYTVTWIGHSTLLVQMDGLTILTDPIWSERCSPISFAGPKRYVQPGMAFKDLPDIDVVILSHDHYDHLDKATIKKLGNKPFYFVPLGIGNFLEKQGITNYTELDWWDSFVYREVEFVCTPAQHFSGRSFNNRNNTLWCSWVINAPQSNFYFAGDTGYCSVFKDIGERYGPFDLVAIPIGAYLPRWFMGPVHVDPGEALKIYADVKGKRFVPIHWGTFDLADEPLDRPMKDLLKEVKKNSLDMQDFLLLKHGETFTIPTSKESVLSAY